MSGALEMEIKQSFHIDSNADIPFSGTMLIAPPKLKCEPYEDGYSVGFEDENIHIYMFGNTQDEAYETFWDYIYDLFEDLESEPEANLSPAANRNRDFLRQYLKRINSQR